jgi:hypothetical protein
MRRLAILVATIAMLSIAPAANAAPPPDRVFIIDDGGGVECDGGSLTFTTTGWVNGKPDTGFSYHLTWVFSNADGESWTYIDTGRVRTFERGGVIYGSLSGRSVNVGPDQSSWIGHWVLNTETGEESRAGHGLGYIEEIACSRLT